MVLVSGSCRLQRRAGHVTPSEGWPLHPALGRGQFPSFTPLPSSQPLRLHPIALPNSMGGRESPSAPRRGFAFPGACWLDPDPLPSLRAWHPPGPPLRELPGRGCAAPCAWGCQTAPWGARGAGGFLLGLGKRSSKPTCLETSQRRFPAPNFSEFSCRGVQLPPPLLPPHPFLARCWGGT